MSKRLYPSDRPKAVDLFCGAGGMSLGFEQAGFDVVLGVDTDGHHIAAHHRNFPTGKSVCASVRELTGKLVRESAGLRGQLDLLFGGPPCQGFSHMGLRDKRDPRNTLVNEFVRLALELRPKFVVMENVAGMLSGNTRAVLDAAISDLSAEYNITQPVRLLNALDFGVPQDRRRIFVLAARKDQLGPVRYPERPCPGQPKLPTVDEAIGDLPDVDGEDALFRRDWVAYDEPPRSHYARVARGDSPDPSDLSVPRIWDSAVCYGCTRTRHTRSTIDLYESTPPGHTVPGHKLPRLDGAGICPTLRAGSDSSRGSYTSPRPIHPNKARCITVREAARLHGYPDWFRFVPTKWHAYKQIGNSVCPPVARAVGHQILAMIQPDCTKVAPSPVPLPDEFIVPVNAPKQSRRIPHLREFPPVIQQLFAQAYDEVSGRLWKDRFRFSDVMKAIEETGAHLPWIREDTFLQEIRRSRSVPKILADPLKHGFSIAIERKGGFIGRFVPADRPGTIEKKDDAGIKTAELANAIEVNIPSSRLRDFDELNAVALLDHTAIRTRVWTESVVSVEAAQKHKGDGGSPATMMAVRRSSGRTRRSLLLVGTDGNVPPRSRVTRTAKRNRQEEVVVATPLTVKHVLISRYIRAGSTPKEIFRAVFSLDGRIH